MTSYRIRKELADIVAPDPVDRVDVVKQLVGELTPNLKPTLPAKKRQAERTRQSIGRVHVAERMTPCDEVVAVIRHDDTCQCTHCRRAS